MNTPRRLVNGMDSKQAHALAAAAGIVSIPLDRFALRRRDLNGLLLGFAAFEEIGWCARSLILYDTHDWSSKGTGMPAHGVHSRTESEKPFRIRDSI